MTGRIQTNGQMSKAEWAGHKFNQKRIMAMADRRDLVVRYFRAFWVFIEPVSDKPWTDSLDDEMAIAWLQNIPYPRKMGTLEKI